LTAHKIVTYGSRGNRGGGKGGKTGRRRGGDEGWDGEVALTCAYAPAGGAALRPEHVSAEVIRALLKAAEAYLGSAAGGGSSAPVKITRAVITVPAYFLPAQCEATTRAGQLAGLQKVKLLREPGMYGRMAPADGFEVCFLEAPLSPLCLLRRTAHALSSSSTHHDHPHPHPSLALQRPRPWRTA
jgi:hypothetical protein